MFGIRSLEPAGGAWAGQENIVRSAWFDGSADYLERTAGSAWSNPDRGIIVAHVRFSQFAAQRCIIQAYSSGASSSGALQFESTGRLWFYWNGTYYVKTEMIFRDMDWYTIVASLDSSQATAADRIQLYNGRDLLTANTSNYPPLNQDVAGMSYASTPMKVGIYEYQAGNFYHWHGKMAQVCLFESVSIQNGDYAISDFVDEVTVGTNGSVWVPKPASAMVTIANAAGGESFVLSSDIGDGTDDSTNANNFTPISMSDAANGSTDSPSDPDLVFAALVKPASTLTISEGGQVAELATGTLWVPLNILVPPNTKQYIEIEQVSGNGNFAIGVCNPEAEQDASPRSSGFLHWEGDGDRYLDGVQTATEVSSWSSGDTLGLGINTVDNELLFYDNAGNLDATVSFGANVDGSAGVLVYMGQLSGGSAQKGRVISDGASLTHSLPSGYTVLRSANLPAPETHGADVFEALPYTADNTASQAQTGAGFQPDMVWAKGRNTASSHKISDSSRGVQLAVQPDLSNAEASESTGLLSFDSDGFTHGNLGGWGASFNYMAYCWKVNGGSTASNTDGDITSTVQVAPEGHMSIVKWAGNATADQAIGHGMSNRLSAVLVKNRTDAEPIFVWVRGMGAQYLNLSNSSVLSTSSTIFPGEPANATTFRVGSYNGTNGSGDDMIAYCFADVPGLLRAGEYKGNGNSDGALVITGFRPRFFLTKSQSTAHEWCMYDTARRPENENSVYFHPDTAAVEGTAFKELDILANGVKMRTNTPNLNTNNGLYSFLAIADIAPGVGLPPPPGR